MRTGKILPLLLLATLVPTAAIPAAAQAVTFTKKADTANRTIVCSEVKETTSGLRLVFRDVTGANVVFSDSNIDDLRIEITPSVKNLSAELSGNAIHLIGDFQPETRYSIQIKGDLRAVSGNALKRNPCIQHKTSALPPQMRFLTDGLYFATGAKNFSLPYRLRTTKEYKLEIYRLYDNNLDINEFSKHNISNFGEPIVNTTIQVPQAAMSTKMYYGNLDLNQYIKNRKKGIYAIRFFDPKRATDNWQYYGREDTRIVIVTDLGISAAVDTQKGCATVAVQSLADGKAVKGATVRAISNKRQLLARGLTGKDGILKLEFPKKFKEQNHEKFSHFIIEKDDDKIIFHPDHTNNLALAQNINRFLADTPNAFVYGERDIFRPGETVRISAFIRQMNKGKSAILADAPLKFFLYSNTQDKIIDTKMIRTDKYGYAAMEFKLPSSLR